MSDPLAAEALLLEALRHAQGGDEKALGFLLERLLPVARAWCLGRLQDPELRDLVDDIVQETGIRVVRHIETCRASSVGELAAWVVAISRRESLRVIESGWMRYWVSLEGLDVSGPQEPTSSMASAGTVVGSPLERAYAELPEATQRLLYTRLIEGRSWEEVGAEFRTSAAGAKRRYQRAILRLKARVIGASSEASSALASLLDRLKEQA